MPVLSWMKGDLRSPLKKEVIVKSGIEFGEYFFSVSVRPQSDGCFRLFLSLKILNANAEYKKSKMETISVISAR